MNVTIALLQSSIDKLGKASQLETFVIQHPATSPWHLSEEPAQMQPDVQQEEAQANQHETIGRISGGRPTPYLSCTAITGFNTETTAVGSLGLTGRKVQVDQDEDQPTGTSFHSSSAFGGGEHAADSQIGGEGLVLVLEGMADPIALVPLAQSTGSPGLAPDGAGDQRRQATSGQIVHHLNPSKAFVQEQAAHLDSQRLYATQQEIQHSDGIIAWQEKANRQSAPQSLQYHICRSDPVEPRRTTFRFATHPQPFCLRCLAVVRPVMEIDGNITRRTPDTWGNLRYQSGIQALFQFGQIFHDQLLIQVLAEGFSSGHFHQISADRFDRVTVGSSAKWRKSRPGLTYRENRLDWCNSIAEVNGMPGPKPPAVVLTEEETRDLEKLVRRHSTRQQIALRARIVLAAAAGKNNAEIADEEGIDVQTARRWRDRWLDLHPIPMSDLRACPEISSHIYN